MLDAKQSYFPHIRYQTLTLDSFLSSFRITLTASAIKAVARAQNAGHKALTRTLHNIHTHFTLDIIHYSIGNRSPRTRVKCWLQSSTMQGERSARARNKLWKEKGRFRNCVIFPFCSRHLNICIVYVVFVDIASETSYGRKRVGAITLAFINHYLPRAIASQTLNSVFTIILSYLTLPHLSFPARVEC
jgi:hypothetical protein